MGILITNNKLVFDQYKDKLEIVYDEKFDYVSILEMVRNRIHESILTTRKFLNDKKTPNWTETILDDFRVIDYSLISNVLNKI